MFHSRVEHSASLALEYVCSSGSCASYYLSSTYQCCYCKRGSLPCCSLWEVCSLSSGKVPKNSSLKFLILLLFISNANEFPVMFCYSKFCFSLKIKLDLKWHLNFN